MKQITLILAFVGMIALSSCSNDDEDKDTIAEVFRYSNVDFLPNDYTVVLEFPHALYYDSDMVLVYRRSGTYQGEPVWKLLPESYYFDDGTLDFKFDNDYTRYDTEVRLQGYDLPNLNNNVRLGQSFRVVVIPAAFGNKRSTVDFKDYKAVVKAFNIDESKEIVVKQ